MANKSAHAHPLSLARLTEPILVTLASLFLYIAFAYFAPGGPFGTDVIGYMDIGLNGLKAGDGFYNRYFHILLQRVFLKAAPTPLQGTQFYWAFLIAATCLLIYLSARLFSPRSRPFHGLLAVALFLSIEAIADRDGITDIDTTAMFVIMLFTTVYLLSARIGHRSIWLILLLGFIFYLGFKTKESVLPAGVLLIGLGLTEQDKFDWPAFLKRLLYFAAGMAAGLIFIAGWTWTAVGDPLFGLRPSEFKEYLSAYGSAQLGGQSTNTADNWLTGIFFNPVLVPTILFILSGIKTSALPLTRRLVWLVPLLVVLVLSVTIGNKWGLQVRYAFPALPLICLLGVQFLDFHATTRREGMIALALFLGGLLAYLGLRLLMRLVLPKLGMDIVDFLNIAVYPCLLMFLLAVYFLIEHPGLKTSVLALLCLMALLVSPLIRNYKVMFLYRQNQQAMNVVFYPFSTFSAQIAYRPDMHMYVSTNTWVVLKHPVLTKNLDEIKGAYNIFFNVNSGRSNFTFDTPTAENFSALLNSDYTEILMSQKDWQLVTADPQNLSLAEQKYQVFDEPKNLLVLLKAH